MVFVRKVKTGSGATAVQIAERRGGRDKVLEHVGSARTPQELAVLMALARSRCNPGQGVLDLDGVEGEVLAPSEPAVAGRAGRGRGAGGPRGAVIPLEAGGVVLGSSSALLCQVLRRVWSHLGFDVVGDEAFFQLVLARLVQPGSVADAPRVLADLGVVGMHRNTLMAALKRARERDYRGQIAAACFAHATACGDLTLVLYDVTTLYFEAEHEDELRKVGYSKERRVDPQIVVGLLVDRAGFPLEITCWEGNKAETATLLPTVRAFQERHSVADMVVVADAGMLSAANLKALDEAGLKFIVGSRQTKAPADLESHFRWHGDAFTDGQLIDTITPRHARATGENDTTLKAEPVWDAQQHPKSWRAVWAYSAKRAARDGRTLTLQENRAKAVVAGEKAARTPRFVTTRAGTSELDQAALARARRLVGLKGYVTNIPAQVMPASEVISSYHDLWNVEASFRMSKTDLRARPIFHHDRDAIEAHLTVVITALAIARHLHAATGMSIKKIVRTLRPLQHVRVRIAGQDITAEPQLTPDARRIIDATTH